MDGLALGVFGGGGEGVETGIVRSRVTEFFSGVLATKRDNALALDDTEKKNKNALNLQVHINIYLRSMMMMMMMLSLGCGLF